MADEKRTRPTETKQDAAGCEANCPPGTDAPAGPVREGGGTTGAGNLSPGQASRTGGATGGVGSATQPPPRPGPVTPDA